MAAPLVASLVLKLEDQLGGPLRKMIDLVDQLHAAADRVSFGGLSRAEEIVGSLIGKIRGATGALEGMKVMAREVGGAMVAMGRMAGAGLSDIKNKAHAFSEAGSNLVNKGFGAAAEGFAVYEPIKEYAERDKLLRSIGIMQHLQGPALEAEIRRLNTLVNTDALRTGQTSESVAEAYKDLLGQGLPRNMIDGIIGAHSAAAQAYGIHAEVLGPVTGALAGNMKIAPNEADTGSALAAIANASQSGRFKMEDFARELPGLTGVAASLGMTGRGSLNELVAGLEISTKTASDPAQAGVNFHDLLAYITSNREDSMMRKKLGIDLPKLLLRGEKEGRNPLDVFLGEIKKLTQGKTPVAQAQLISSVVTNQQARNALLALVQHNDEFEQLRKTLAGINAEKLKADQDSASAGAQTGLDKAAENIHQIMLTLGQGFAPVLAVVNRGLGWINEKLTFMNEHFPKTTAYILGGIAALLALGAAITLLGAVVPVFTTGLALLLSPLRTVLGMVKYLSFLLEYFTGATLGAWAAIAAMAAALVFAATDIYDHWGRFAGFFADMWNGVKQTFHGFIEFLTGVFTGNMSQALSGLTHIGSGLAKAFGAEWAIVKTVFMDFAGWVDGWSGGFASRILAGITSSWGVLTGGVHNLVGQLENSFDNSKLGRLLGLATQKAGVPAPAGAAPKGSPLAGAPGANGTVTVKVQAEPGTTVKAATASPGITVQTPNRGSTVTRP